MSSIAQRKKRRRTSSRRTFDEVVDPKEEKMIKIAIANSKVDTQRTAMPIPCAPIFHPTLDEFSDPMKYILRYITHMYCHICMCLYVMCVLWQKAHALFIFIFYFYILLTMLSLVSRVLLF